MLVVQSPLNHQLVTFTWGYGARAGTNAHALAAATSPTVCCELDTWQPQRQLSRSSWGIPLDGAQALLSMLHARVMAVGLSSPVGLNSGSPMSASHSCLFEMNVMSPARLLHLQENWLNGCLVFPTAALLELSCQLGTGECPLDIMHHHDT